jgi:hypothetical protein
MRLQRAPELVDRQMEREIERFLEFTGRDVWKDQIEKLNQQLSSPKFYFYKVWLRDRSTFLIALGEYLELVKQGKSIWRNASPLLKYYSKQLFILNFVAKNSCEIAKKKILGKFRTPKEINSFLFELQIATHFLIKGFDVLFVDLESSGKGQTFDFLIESDGTEGEIECKRKSVDAGRKITREGFYLLSDAVVSRVYGRGQNMALNITCKISLGKNQNDFQNYALKIQEAVQARQNSVELSQNLSAEILYLPEEVRIHSNEEAAKMLAPSLPQNAYCAIRSSGDGTVIPRALSETKDKVLKSIFDEIEDGSHQLTRKRPSMIACYIEDIEEEDWKDLKDESGLANMTATFFSKESNSHVNRVAYSSGPDFQIAFQNNSTENLSFKNLRAKFKVSEGFFSFSK